MALRAGARRGVPGPAALLLVVVSLTMGAAGGAPLRIALRRAAPPPASSGSNGDAGLVPLLNYLDAQVRDTGTRREREH